MPSPILATALEFRPTAKALICFSVITRCMAAANGRRLSLKQFSAQKQVPTFKSQ
jgi:hypothetical protein